uniref:Uncharacterized protein n=1 Tax=Arundo donax TaxID=35708 RepID=A0A0A8YHZ4_ARUDO
MATTDTTNLRGWSLRGFPVPAPPVK